MKIKGWKVSPSPFIQTRPTIATMAQLQTVCLLPVLVLLLIDRDISAVVNILLTIAGCLATEVCMRLVDKKVSRGHINFVLTGLLTGLLLPSSYPPVMAFGASFAGSFFSRGIFGGTGANWMHPSAVSVGIAYIGYPAVFPGFLVSPDSIRTVGDAFGALRLDSFLLAQNDQSVAAALNSSFLSFFDIRIPEGYVTLFWRSPSVIPAVRYNFLILVSSIILIGAKALDWIVPLVSLTVYSLLLFVISLFPLNDTLFSGDILFGLLTSGILFTVFYILSDPSTLPRTGTGKICTGIIAGILFFIMCGPGGSSSGALFSVLLANSVVPVIEKIEKKIYLASRKAL